MPHRKLDFIVPFQRRFLLNLFNENYTAGEKIKNTDQNGARSSINYAKNGFPMGNGTSYSKTSISIRFGHETCFVD